MIIFFFWASHLQNIRNSSDFSVHSSISMAASSSRSSDEKPNEKSWRSLPHDDCWSSMAASSSNEKPNDKSWISMPYDDCWNSMADGKPNEKLDLKRSKDFKVPAPSDGWRRPWSRRTEVNSRTTAKASSLGWTREEFAAKGPFKRKAPNPEHSRSSYRSRQNRKMQRETWRLEQGLPLFPQGPVDTTGKMDWKGWKEL